MLSSLTAAAAAAATAAAANEREMISTGKSKPIGHKRVKPSPTALTTPFLKKKAKKFENLKKFSCFHSHPFC